ncbi:PRC-barrel domain-containing protein [Microbacteriaceae bacterium K1510]|nr:PRC-barrel domain-containing protein [Microbacteriaceae bacterium K1510]
MFKQLMIGASVSALMVSGALAQSSSAPSGSSGSPPAAAQTSPSGGMASGQAHFIASQKPDQLLASKFKGTNVLGSDNEKIGDVSDILFDKSGKIEAYVVSVGGFLGMGAKEVAMAPSSFETVPGDNGGAPKLKTSMTKDQLTNAQNFARYEAPKPAATTGAGGAGSAGGGMGRPASPSGNR